MSDNHLIEDVTSESFAIEQNDQIKEKLLFVAHSPNGPSLCRACGKETNLDIAVHMFLDHTRHTKGYVCTECDVIDVVTHRFQRHLLTMHSREIINVEQFFRPCRPFTKLFECTQDFCVFVTPVCEVMCSHQAQVHADCTPITRQAMSGAGLYCAVGEDRDDTPLFDPFQFLVEAVEPPEELKPHSEQSKVLRPKFTTNHQNVEPSTESGTSPGGGLNANTAQDLRFLETSDAQDRKCFRFVESLPPAPRLHSPRYFPLERMESILRPDDSRYLTQLTFGAPESIFLAMHELPPVGDSVLMRSCSSPYEIIARVEVTQHRGFPSTQKLAQQCGSNRPWRCSGPMVDTHSKPWGLVRRITMSIPPPRGFFVIVNAIARSSQMCRVITLADS